MQVVKLFRYTRANGGITISTKRPQVEYTELFRLIADNGKALTDGKVMTPCIDTEDVNIWTEIEISEEKI